MKCPEPSGFTPSRVGPWPSWPSVVAHDEWAAGRRYFSTESMNKLKEHCQEEVVQALLELESA
jgi:hypothetical protein